MAKIASGDKKSEKYQKSLTVNLPQSSNNKKERNPTTDKKLSDIAGFTNGGDRKSDKKLFHLKNSDNPNTQEQLAKKYNVTQQTMNNYMRLAKAIPELEDLEDTDICDKTIVIFIRL